MNDEGAWREVIRRYREALGVDSLARLHIHLSGIEYGPKGERKHVPLIESDLDLVPLMRGLAQAGCGGRILCESPIMEQDALLMQQAWAHLSAG